MHTLQLTNIGQNLSKTELKDISVKMVNEISENGFVIGALEQMAKMEFLIKEIKDNSQFKDYAIDEISKYGKSMQTDTGTKIELAEVGVKYDFSNCNDEILTDMQKQLDELEAKVKERKDYLKKVPLSGIEVITSDGEIQKIYPPAKTSTSSYKITLNR